MQNYTVLIGSVGVGILLLAFFLNIFGFLKQDSREYTLLNFLGGGISAYASYLIDYVPFVVLEATWAVVALVAFVRIFRQSS